MHKVIFAQQILLQRSRASHGLYHLTNHCVRFWASTVFMATSRYYLCIGLVSHGRRPFVVQPGRLLFRERLEKCHKQVLLLGWTSRKLSSQHCWLTMGGTASSLACCNHITLLLYSSLHKFFCNLQNKHGAFEV